MSRRGGNGDIYVPRVDARVEPLQLVVGDQTQIPTSWSRQGYLENHEIGGATQREIWAVEATGDADSKPIVRTDANELSAAFSPDGRWLVHVSDEAGRERGLHQSLSDARFGDTGIQLRQERLRP